MKTNHNKLPDVNQYIKKHKLKPNFTEQLCGVCYNDELEITYLVVLKDNTYVSYSLDYIAKRDAFEHNALLVTCRGEIK